MWETICDAWACWSGWKFGANSTEYPYSVIQNTPPPKKNWNLGRSWDFEYFQLQNTPPPRKLKFSQILGLSVFSITEYPPSENWNLARSWDFEYFQLQNTPPPKKNWNLARSWDFQYFQLQNTPPPENWNLARSWDFEYFQLQNTPQKLKFSQILGLWVFSITEYPPPQKNWNLARSWDFEYFQLQNTPPPENWNLARSWDFEYFQLQNTPPPIPKLKFSQILGLWVFSITEYPPLKIEISQILGLWVFSITEYPPQSSNWNLGRSWDFEYFQLQNTPPQTPTPPPRSSQWETMCSKLPHVETLSNMDNYSLVLPHKADWPGQNLFWVT